MIYIYIHTCIYVYMYMYTVYIFIYTRNDSKVSAPAALEVNQSWLPLRNLQRSQKRSIDVRVSFRSSSLLYIMLNNGLTMDDNR